jgi:hypothetical protein
MAASDVFDVISRHLDRDSCVSEVNCCKNCLRLKDYVKVLLIELKSSHEIIKILHEDQTNLYNLKSQVNLQNFIPKPKVSTKVSQIGMKDGKAEHKIQILGDSHARGLANELKYKLTCDYEIQGVWYIW